MLGSFRPLRRAWSGRSAAASLKNSITWRRSTTEIADILVLAEPVIGDVQVGEIDAVKGLDAGAYRLLVVERGGNEFIDVDQFDIERPAHMGAPGA